MKDIETKDLPDVSGGYSPDDDDPLPSIGSDLPRQPFGLFPEPLPGPAAPEPFVPAK
jgi:hypothetical protein